jgi:hypothetical protein
MYKESVVVVWFCASVIEAIRGAGPSVMFPARATTDEAAPALPPLQSWAPPTRTPPTPSRDSLDKVLEAREPAHSTVVIAPVNLIPDNGEVALRSIQRIRFP